MSPFSFPFLPSGTRASRTWRRGRVASLARASCLPWSSCAVRTAVDRPSLASADRVVRACCRSVISVVVVTCVARATCVLRWSSSRESLFRLRAGLHSCPRPFVTRISQCRVPRGCVPGCAGGWPHHHPGDNTHRKPPPPTPSAHPHHPPRSHPNRVSCTFPNSQLCPRSARVPCHSSYHFLYIYARAADAAAGAAR